MCMKINGLERKRSVICIANCCNSYWLCLRKLLLLPPSHVMYIRFATGNVFFPMEFHQHEMLVTANSGVLWLVSRSTNPVLLLRTDRQYGAALPNLGIGKSWSSTLRGLFISRYFASTFLKLPIFPFLCQQR